MKSLIAAAIAAACLSTSAFALTTPATLSDADKDQLIERCLAKGTLDPDTLEGRPEAEVIQALQDCADGPAAATQAAAPAPVVTQPAPVVVRQPVVRYSRPAAAVVEEDDPAPSYSGGGFSGSGFGGGRFGRGGGFGGGDGGGQGGDGGDQVGDAGGNTGGGQGQGGKGQGGKGQGGGTADTGDKGTGGNGTGGNTPGSQANNKPPMTQSQKDAVEASKFKPNENKISTTNIPHDNGTFTQVTKTQTKDQNGNVHVTTSEQLRDKNGKPVGNPIVKNQDFTPKDIADIQATHSQKLLMAKAVSANGSAFHKGLKTASLGDRIRDKMLANGKLPNGKLADGKLPNGKLANGGKVCVKAPCNSATSSQAGKSALERFKQMQAKTGDKHQTGKTAIDRFKQMQANAGNKHQTGKNALERFKQMQAKHTGGNVKVANAKIGNAKVTTAKTHVGNSMSNRHIGSKHPGTVSKQRVATNHKVGTTHTTKMSGAHRQLFKQHTAKVASSHKSSGGAKKVRIAHR